MAKLKRFVLIPLIGSALVLSLAAVAACGGGKKAKLTLDAGGGGSLSKTEYSVKAGADLSGFLDGKQPSVTVEGLEFAGWYNGSDLIEEGDTMPEGGLTLTAKYYAPYSLTVQFWDDAPAVTTGKAIWHEPFNIFDVYKTPDGWETDDTQTSTTSTSSLEAGDAFVLYLREIEIWVTFRSNAPDGVEAGGQMPSQSLQYGKTFYVPACAFTLPGEYRFAGWTKSGGAERYFEGDAIEDVSESFSLYANWDRGYEDLGGGDDVIFFPSAEKNVALLVREGLGEKRGTYDPATRVFSFALDNGEKLTGRVTGWDEYTFSYQQSREEVVYTYRDAFTEEDDGAVTLTLDTFDGAVFADTKGATTGMVRTAEGVYSLYGTLGGENIYIFLSEDATFFFKLGDREDIFYIQGLEAGSYTLITEEGLDDYCVLELDGFGKAYYEEYADAWTVSEGTYTLLDGGECEIDLGGEKFRCLLVQVDVMTYGFLVADPSLSDTFTSKDGKTTIALDSYGDLGYATVTEEGGKSTVYAKYWDVFSLTEDGTTAFYRYLRCIDDYTGEILRTFLFDDDGNFEEVGAEAGQYFMFDLTDSSLGLFFLTFDGRAAQDALGGWKLYSFVAEGDETIATLLAEGSYTAENGSYLLTLKGAAAEEAPAPFKTSPVTVLVSEVSNNTTVLGVFVVDDESREMTMYAADGSEAKIEIDGYGRVIYTEAGGGMHMGTFATADFDGDAPVQDSDGGKDCILGITESGTGAVYYFYLPYGLGNDNRFYPMGAEYGTYEGGEEETYGTYLYLSGFAGESGEGGYALLGSTSSSLSGYIYVVQGVYRFEREEYYGTIWKFEGQYWNDNTRVPEGMRPTDISFSFVLDEIADYPVYRVYDEEDEVEYEGPNGESLIVTGVRTARFTDAEGHVWTGEAGRSEQVDFYGRKIADTVIFSYLGADGGYYDFTFRVDDKTGTFLIQGAEVGQYYAIDPADMTVNGALRIALDGYGGAAIYIPNPKNPDYPEDTMATILATGSYEEADGGAFRFIPEDKFAGDYPAFTFGLSSFTESVSHGSTVYAVYFVYDVEREGTFIDGSWAVLTLNGYDTAVYIDGRGRRIEGTFTVLGEHVVRLRAGTADLFFSTDAAKHTFSLYEDDLIIENGVVIAYTGTSQNVVISDPTVTKIGRGAFLDAQIASIDLGNVTEIGERAFDGATLSSVKGGGNVQRIGDQAFLYCDNLTSVNFPKAVYVGRQAFAHCYFLESVTLGGEVTFLGDRAFESCLVDPLELTSLGTFKLILGNKTTAPDLGGAGVFALYYSEGAYARDIDFTVRVAGLDALKAFFLDEKWQNGSKSLVGASTGKTFEHSVCFAEAGDEAGAWYALATLERIFLDGVITVNGQYFGAYELKEGTLTVYSYVDPAQKAEGNLKISTATLADGTLTADFGGGRRLYKQQGTELTYRGGGEGDLVLTLRENFPLLGEYGGRKALVTAENGKAVFTLSGYRHEATLSEELTFTVVTSRAAFDEFIEGEGGSLRITMDEEGNVTMRNCTLSVGGQQIAFNLTTDCGQVTEGGEPVENAYYFDVLIGEKNYRVTIRVSVTLDEEALAYNYSFTASSEEYLTLKAVQDTAEASRSVVFGYDKEGAVKNIWLRYTVENFAGLRNIYNVKGTWEAADDGYRFYAVDGYDPVEGITFEIKTVKDAAGNITSVTVSEYLAEIDFTGEAEDGSTVHIVSKKDEAGNMHISVEGTFQNVAGKPFTSKATGRAECISGNTFAVYTTKELDETQYYRILITIEPLNAAFTYKAERSGDVLGTKLTTSEGETYTVWVYSPQKGVFNTTTWFFMQLETTVDGETILLDGTAEHKSCPIPGSYLTNNVEFVVTTPGDFADRIYQMYVGVGFSVSSFIAL